MVRGEVPVEGWRRPGQAVARYVFGDDVFLSYSRVDSSYVIALANQLVGFRWSPYVDQWASPVGRELPRSLTHALKRASMLVIIATQASGKSEHVEREIEVFLETARPVCIVEVDGALATARWRGLVAGPEPIRETAKALAGHKPSEDVARRIVDAARFTTAKARIRMLVLSGFLVLVVAALCVGWLGRRASAARSAASASAMRADAEDRRARDASSRADQATAETAKAKELLVEVRKEVTEAEAVRNTAQAEAQREVRLARSIGMARESTMSLATDPFAAMQLALRAFQLEPTDEAKQALREALGAPRPSCILPGRYTDLVFGSGRYFTLGTDGRVMLWDERSGVLLRSLPEANIQTAEWSSDGGLLVTTTSAGKVNVWDASSGQLLSDISFPAGTLRHACFGPGNRSIAVALADGRLVFWKPQTGDVVTLFTFEEQGVAAHRVWYVDHFLYLWSEKERSYQESVWYVSDKGQLEELGAFPELYLAPPRRPQGAWQVVSGKFEKSADRKDFSMKLSGTHLALDARATFAITATDNVATVWHGWTHRPLIDLRAHESAVVHAAFSKDHTAVATVTSGGVARIWPFYARLLYRGADRPTLKDIVSIAFSPDGSKLATGDIWGDVLLWDLSTGVGNDLADGPKELSREDSIVLFDTSGDHLLISAQRGRAFVWDWQKKQTVASVKLEDGELARFAKSGRVAAAPRSGGGINLWWPGSGVKAERDRTTSFCSLALTPDGVHIVTASAKGLVQVHRIDSWTVVASLDRKLDTCASLALDASIGDTVVVWSAQQALLWRWKQTSTAARLETGPAAIVAAAVDDKSHRAVLATKSALRLFGTEDSVLLRDVPNIGRENHSVALSGQLLATGEGAMGAGAYPYIQQCPDCVPDGQLLSSAQRAIARQVRQSAAAKLPGQYAAAVAEARTSRTARVK